MMIINYLLLYNGLSQGAYVSLNPIQDFITSTNMKQWNCHLSVAPSKQQLDVSSPSNREIKLSSKHGRISTNLHESVHSFFSFHLCFQNLFPGPGHCGHLTKRVFFTMMATFIKIALWIWIKSTPSIFNHYL